MKRYTLDNFLAEFGTDEQCLEWLMRRRWPEGIHCEKCERVTPHHAMTTRKSYSCDYCGHHVHPTAGTIFHKSSTKLHKWFYAIYLMSQTRCGISAKQIEREVGVTYKTAWRMFKQIRSMLGNDDGPLKGTVEVDETFVGGRPRHRQSRPGPRSKTDPTAKTPVVGMVERGGEVRAFVTPDVKSKTIRPLLSAYIMPSTTVFTDDAMQYSPRTMKGYPHRRINHSARVYVDGNVHTNTIEGFWSLLKNGIRGTYHAVGSDYLQSYVDEYAFRYNHRKDSKPMFKTMLDLTPRQVA